MNSSDDKTPRACPYCNGSGHQARGCNIWPCDACKGSGVVEEDED